MEVEDKYWIKPGISVEHKDHEGMKMTVDKVLSSQNAEGRKFTKGVLCHWIGEGGRYEQGTFHTTELKPCDIN